MGTSNRRPGRLRGRLQIALRMCKDTTTRPPPIQAALAAVGVVLVLTACRMVASSSPGSALAGEPPLPSGRAQRAAALHDGRPQFDHGPWDAVLKQHVDDRGRVDYARISKDDRLAAYLRSLAAVDPQSLADDKQRLAFWINAYNALTLRAVLDTLPADRSKWPDYRINEQKLGGRSIWKAREFAVGGDRWTLDGIEHDILRRWEGLRDPRIHVALVCAARGCPRLWNRAYRPEAIDAQLTEAMRRFLADPSQCKIDAGTRTIRISKVFKWYAADFTDARFSPHAGTIPAFLAKYTEDKALAKALDSGSWKIHHYDYDWRLNLRP